MLPILVRRTEGDLAGVAVPLRKGLVAEGEGVKSAPGDHLYLLWLPLDRQPNLNPACYPLVLLPCKKLVKARTKRLFLKFNRNRKCKTYQRTKLLVLTIEMVVQPGLL